MIERVEDVLADERGQAQVLRHNGHPREADLIERVCDRVASAAEDYLRFLTESDAMLRSNRGREWFRSRYAEWETAGHAKKQAGVRYYRAIIVPQRANIAAAREEGLKVGMRRAG